MKKKTVFLWAFCWLVLSFVFGTQRAFAVTNPVSATPCIGTSNPLGYCATDTDCTAAGRTALGDAGCSKESKICCVPYGTVSIAGDKKTAADPSKNTVAGENGQCTTAGTKCTNMAPDGSGWRSPDGMECWYENVCASEPVMRACCRDLNSKTQNNNSNSNSSAKNGTQTGGAGGVTAGNPTSFTNPLEFKTVEGFLGGIMSAIQKIIVVLALTFMVFGGFMYVTAGANPDNAETGKKAIVSALVGLAIALAAPSLLKELGNTIGWGGVEGSAVGGALGISDIALRVLNFLLGTMGIVALVMMVIGATLYLTSAGDEDRIDQGKDIFKYSVIGIIMAMAAMILVRQVAQFFI